MSKFYVMFFTKSNHATQFMTVDAIDKGSAKAAVRAKFNEQVFFMNITKA